MAKLSKLSACQITGLITLLAFIIIISSTATDLKTPLNAIYIVPEQQIFADCNYTLSAIDHLWFAQCWFEVHDFNLGPMGVDCLPGEYFYKCVRELQYKYEVFLTPEGDKQ